MDAALSKMSKLSLYLPNYCLLHGFHVFSLAHFVCLQLFAFPFFSEDVPCGTVRERTAAVTCRSMEKSLASALFSVVSCTWSASGQF